MKFKIKNKKIIYYYKRYNWIIKLIITFSLLTILFKNVDIFHVIKLFKDIKAVILIPFILYLPALLLSTLKWQLILREQLPFWYLLKIYWIGNFFSNFLPSTIGGDGYRIITITNKVTKEKAIASIMFDRISGFIATVILFVIFFFFFMHYFRNYYNFILIFVLLLVLVIISYLVICFFDFKKILIYQKVRDLTLEFHSNLGKVLLISFSYLFLGVTSLWCYYYMFGYHLNFFLVAAFFFTIQLVSLIPISINAIGIYEISLIGLFSLVGVPKETSLAISLISRFIMLMQTSFGGLLYLVRKE